MPKGRSLPDHAVIILLVDEYRPRRFSISESIRARFALYRSGVTVGGYRSTMGRRFSRQQADDGLRYDQGQGYIYVDENPPDDRIMMR